jgi:hypothetical protein
VRQPGLMGNISDESMRRSAQDNCRRPRIISSIKCAMYLPHSITVPSRTEASAENICLGSSVKSMYRSSDSTLVLFHETASARLKYYQGMPARSSFAIARQLTRLADLFGCTHESGTNQSTRDQLRDPDADRLHHKRNGHSSSLTVRVWCRTHAANDDDDHWTECVRDEPEAMG